MRERAQESRIKTRRNWDGKEDWREIMRPKYEPRRKKRKSLISKVYKLIVHARDNWIGGLSRSRGECTAVIESECL